MFYDRFFGLSCIYYGADGYVYNRVVTSVQVMQRRFHNRTLSVGTKGNNRPLLLSCDRMQRQSTPAYYRLTLLPQPLYPKCILNYNERVMLHCRLWILAT
jgi:hypothetical protein